MKGICFIEQLFHKVVDGTKTHTRRIVVLSFLIDDHTAIHAYEDGSFGFFQNGFLSERLKPRYKKGEVVYLKEPWEYEGEQGYSSDPQRFIYKYNYPYCVSAFVDKDTVPDMNKVAWKNKLFMPLSSARHFIKMKNNVSVERLQDISNEDCIKEGIFKHISHARAYWKFPGSGDMYFNTPRDAYAFLIDVINGKGTWESNPFVWVYDFEITGSEYK